jgi:hypothetical protein
MPGRLSLALAGRLAENAGSEIWRSPASTCNAWTDTE